MNSNQLRADFLRFFQQHGHLVQAGISLVPDDPSLLFTSAGMVPMKGYFLGLEEPPARRMVTVQKCFRATDIDYVGRTARHLTFLEMLGNFSVGDYFKTEAIEMAWEFLVGELALPPDRLWVSVYHDDDEAAGIWANTIGIPRDRIVRLGEADNFWGPVGTTGTGPCGPCSEIYFDLGSELDPAARPGDESPRFVEVWNLVFMEFNKDQQGRLIPLAQKNIDTGMGLERLAMASQGKNTVFASDLFQPLIDAVSAIGGLGGDRSLEQDIALRVIADHLRAMTFLVGDGVVPSNEGRGYVLRRIIRRAFRFGRHLQLRESFLYQLVPKVAQMMGQSYPELQTKEGYIQTVVKAEETRFAATLEDGMAILENLLRGLPSPMLSGADAFRLYDTYGFPLELTEEIAQEQRISVDREGFAGEMRKQRERARAALKKVGMETSPFSVLRERRGESEFVGYQTTESNTPVLALFAGGQEVGLISTGKEGEAYLGETPFYAEKGGQIGDCGRLIWPSGEAEVLDAQSPLDGVTLHRVKVKQGTLTKELVVKAEVDLARRKSIERAHTATHLLHSALHKVVGEHVNQAGSLVESDRLRFDFHHLAALTAGEIAAIEQQVNEMIRADLAVTARETTLEEAKKLGAMALFNQKYSDVVRVVEAGDSRELCGGTHVTHTGEVGTFLILLETGVGSNLRRIEALTGVGAIQRLQQERTALQNSAEMLRGQPLTLAEKVEKLLTENAEERRQAIAYRDRYLRSVSTGLLHQDRTTGIPRVIALVDSLDIDALTVLSDFVLEGLPEGVVVLASIWQDKPLILIRIGSRLVQAGWNAGQLAREAGIMIDGSGGGKSEMGRAGGKNPARLGEALEKVGELIQAASARA
jgi:alanyl-tRNA synthetase